MFSLKICIERYTVDLLRKIKWFFINIWTQRKALWEARPWDYSGMHMYMKYKLKDMSSCQRKYSLHMGKDKHCDRMDICVELLDRIIEDEYLISKWDFVEDDSAFMGIRQFPKYDFPATRKSIRKRDCAQETYDLEYLHKLLNKYTRNWWD